MGMEVWTFELYCVVIAAWHGSGCWEEVLEVVIDEAFPPITDILWHHPLRTTSITTSSSPSSSFMQWRQTRCLQREESLLWEQGVDLRCVDRLHQLWRVFVLADVSGSEGQMKLPSDVRCDDLWYRWRCRRRCRWRVFFLLLTCHCANDVFWVVQRSGDGCSDVILLHQFRGFAEDKEEIFLQHCWHTLKPLPRQHHTITANTATLFRHNLWLHLYRIPRLSLPSCLLCCAIIRRRSSTDRPQSL